MLLLTGCGGKDTPVPAPGTVSLSSPADSTACLKSTLTSGSTASVTFSWKAASNADSYRLDVKNQKTQTTTSYNTSNESYTLNLDVNTPYSWDVVAINNTGKVTSDVWEFYLSGTPSSSYAPFPADLISPASGTVISTKGVSSIQVTFKWTASDPDNDIASYAVYLDNTNASTPLIATQMADSTIQTLTSGKTYYWKVVTLDNAGNSSTSEINSFQLK